MAGLLPFVDILRRLSVRLALNLPRVLLAAVCLECVPVVLRLRLRVWLLPQLAWVTLWLIREGLR